MSQFFEDPKIKSIPYRVPTFFTSVDGFTIFGILLERKLKIKIGLASMKSLTYSENPFRNHLQEAFSGFQMTVWEPKRCFESRLRSCMYRYTTENRPVAEKERRKRNSYAAFQQPLEIESSVPYPYVFGPPRSGSVIYLYRSGSFHQ
jgi:hypothetical protein